MQIHHNKLVRDRIPDIIRTEHRHCQTRTLTSSAYCTALKAKLVEEAMEVQNAEDRKALTEELADLSEVVDAVIRSKPSKNKKRIPADVLKIEYSWNMLNRTKGNQTNFR